MIMNNNIIVKFVFIMFAAISLFSCSSDHDLQLSQLTGSWQQTYCDSVVTKEFVQYQFIPMSIDIISRGKCNIKTHDVNHGFVTTSGEYVISDNDSRLLYIFMHLDNGHIETRVFEIKSLSSKEMTLLLIDSGKVLKLRK